MSRTWRVACFARAWRASIGEAWRGAGEEEWSGSGTSDEGRTGRSQRSLLAPISPRSPGVAAASPAASCADHPRRLRSAYNSALPPASTRSAVARHRRTRRSSRAAPCDGRRARRIRPRRVSCSSLQPPLRTGNAASPRRFHRRATRPSEHLPSTTPLRNCLAARARRRHPARAPAWTVTHSENTRSHTRSHGHTHGPCIAHLGRRREAHAVQHIGGLALFCPDLER